MIPTQNRSNPSLKKKHKNPSLRAKAAAAQTRLAPVDNAHGREMAAERASGAGLRRRSRRWLVLPRAGRPRRAAPPRAERRGRLFADGASQQRARAHSGRARRLCALGSQCAIGIASRLEPPGEATELTPTNSAEPLSWESAVGRFGLLPGALLKLRQRDTWLVRLRSVPGMLMIRRTSKIWGFIPALVFKRAISSQLPSTPKDERRLARECKEGLLELGPTFIKLGQLLSTRVDVIPPAFIEELSTLQDQCPPFPLYEVYEILDRELGPNAFAEFDPIPLAAASLGQGERMCVEVQRPGLEELFRVDLKNLQ
ncbi:hypothetical protein T492DRAFT_1152321, partial [Pavlovales sp. CCMP2436]